MLARLLRYRHLQLTAAILLCTGLICFFHRLTLSNDENATSKLEDQDTAVKQSLIENDSLILEKLDIQHPFEFRRYCMKIKKQKGLSRQGLVNISKELSKAALVSSLEPSVVAEKLPPCVTRVDVDVPHFDASGIEVTDILLLGIATKLSRIEGSLIEMRRWLSYTGSQLVVLVVDMPDLESERDRVANLYAKAAELKIDMVLHPYPFTGDSEGLKNFGLAKPLWEEAQRRPKTKWIGIIDDDTFFVSLSQMVTKLNTFDHRASLYLGQLSEGFTRVSREGFKAWGGAGIFLSLPLLDELVNHVEECKSLDVGFGDILWRDCIYHVTSPTVQLTQLEGLNQMDFWGDPSGWYEAGHNPIFTIHHWKSWHFHPIPTAHLVADVGGPDSFLQRYLFAEDSVVLTNGYSFVHYPDGVPDLNLVESTMTEDVGIERSPPWKEFHVSMGRTRPAMKVDVEKKSWVFSHALTDGDGSVRQFYLRRNNDGNGTTSLVEIDWIAT
jgi:hypothetical protein